jgi:hypothetical protein
MRYQKHTKEQLEIAVKNSESVAGVLRQLGYERYGGGHHTHISNRIEKEKIDTSHFTGQGWSKGKISHRKKLSKEILVLRVSGFRAKSSTLKRVLIEIGRKWQCEKCGNEGIWKDKVLSLSIHHKNRDYLDDRQENLQILCPNCHSVSH